MAPIQAVSPSSGLFSCCLGTGGRSERTTAKVAPAPYIPDRKVPKSVLLPTNCTLMHYLVSAVGLLVEEATAFTLPAPVVLSVVAQLDGGRMKRPSLAPPLDSKALIESALGVAGDFAASPALQAIIEGSQLTLPAPSLSHCVAALKCLYRVVCVSAALAALSPPFTAEDVLAKAASLTPLSSPPEVLSACRSPKLSSLLATLWDSCRAGDAVSFPPSGGLHPSFALASLSAILLPHGKLRFSQHDSKTVPLPSHLTLPQLSDPLVAPLPAVLLLLDGPTKFTLLRSFLGFMTPHPSLFRVRVTRGQPLHYIHTALSGGEGKGGATLPPAAILHPRYFTVVPATSGSAKQGGEEGEMVVERDKDTEEEEEEEVGEGQGPRRECFSLCGETSIAQFTPWRDLTFTALDDMQLKVPSHPSPHVYQGGEVRITNPQQQHQQQGVFTSRVMGVREGGVVVLEEPLPEWVFTATLQAAPAPPTLTPLGFHAQVRTPVFPLFEWKEECGYHWIKSGVGEGSLHSLTALGWMLASAPFNASTFHPLALPPALFTLLFKAMQGGGGGGGLTLPPTLLPKETVENTLTPLLNMTTQEVEEYIRAEDLSSDPSHPATRGMIIGRAINASLSLNEGGLPGIELTALLKGWRDAMGSGSSSSSYHTLILSLGFTGLDWQEGATPRSPGGKEDPLPPLSTLFRPIPCKELITPSGAPLLSALWSTLEKWRVEEPSMIPLFLKFVTGSVHPPPLALPPCALMCPTHPSPWGSLWRCWPPSQRLTHAHTLWSSPTISKP